MRPGQRVRARAREVDHAGSYLHKGVDDVVGATTSRTGTSRRQDHAWTTSGSGVSGDGKITSVRGVDWTTDNTRNLKRSGSLSEVLGDVGHGNVVEGNMTEVSTTIGVGVPGFDIALLEVRQASEGNGSGTLASELHSCLEHVARCTTVVGARASAMLDGRRMTMRRIEADATSAIHGSLQLGQVVGTRKLLLGTGVAQLGDDLGISISEEETRATERCLLHDGGVAELLDESLATLDGGVGDLGSLGGVKARPRTTLNAIDECNHAMNIGEVDEGIADIARGLEVDAEVDEVVGAEADIVEDCLERHLQSRSTRFSQQH